jgi:hypothetical protein
MAKKQDLERHPQQLKAEDLSDEVREFLEGETDELPEGAEEITNEEAAELEKKVVEAEPVDEQKKYVNLKEALSNEIKEFEEKNIELKQKADEIEEMVQTICLEPIYGMEKLIKDSIKTYTDRNDIKEVKNEIKNLETVFAFEQLLVGYKTLANEYKSTITANENDIKHNKEKIAELDEKITCFQVKLEIGENDTAKTEPNSETSE